jgi:hypothetical protein
MGLLDDLPVGLLQLFRNAGQNRRQFADVGADGTSDLLPWTGPETQQRPPLGLAGPDLTANIPAGSPSRDWSADLRRTQPPAPTTENLNVRALRMKGVPDADIAAATSNPELMKRLIVQNYGSGSAQRPRPFPLPLSPQGDISPDPAATGMSCSDAYLACRRAGRPTRTCQDAFVTCGKGSSTIFAPGIWGDPRL